MPGALEALIQLKEQGHQLYLISFCGRRRAAETKQVVLDSCPDLFEELYFVENKALKKNICAEIQCDVMIDDTLDILVDIYKSNKNIQLYWFQPFEKKGNTNIKKIILVESWPDVLDKITLKSALNPSV
jgi:hypothetical protein